MKRTYNRHDLIVLKAKIKGLAQEGARTHDLLRRKRGMERDRYWRLKRSIGQETRHHLIAYGLLRGKSFQEIEPNANLDLAFWNLRTKKILDIMDMSQPGHGWTIRGINEQTFLSKKEEAA